MGRFTKIKFNVFFSIFVVAIIIFPSSVLAFAEIPEDEVIISEHYTRPTFGLSHENFEKIVDDGFKFNDISFTIDNNFHTPFPEQIIEIGEVNTFEATIFAEKGLHVQEFLFGIPKVGDAHLAELGVEMWLSQDGKIDYIKVVQKSNVIDRETIIATHEKKKCRELDTELNCNVVNISAVFLEPLKDKVMAIKAIDYKNRYQITYLNEGMNVVGESLNPMPTRLIPPIIRNEGPVKVTEVAKYSPYWVAEDGRLFEMNSFGSFRQINQSFERFDDTGEPLTRLHSGFGKIIDYEKKRALNVFNSTTIQSELPNSFSHHITISERITEELIQEMIVQENVAQKVLDERNLQFHGLG